MLTNIPFGAAGFQSRKCDSGLGGPEYVAAADVGPFSGQGQSELSRSVSERWNVALIMLAAPAFGGTVVVAFGRLIRIAFEVHHASGLVEGVLEPAVRPRLCGRFRA